MTPSSARATVVVAAVFAIGAGVARVVVDAGGQTPLPCPLPVLKDDGVVRCDGVGGDVGDRAWLFGGRLDLNRASAQSLSRIKGIGDGTARAIVAHRDAHGPFARVDDLDAVPGVGPKTLERLRELVEVR
jgi:competence ComEA-like helix-hairpin-helix protein